MSSAIELLDLYSELTAQYDLIRISADQKRDEILQAVQPELDALDAEVLPQLEAAKETIASLANEIEKLVKQEGKTVKGARHQAVYSKGRVTWNNKGLAGYAVANPDVLAFKNEGDPSVSIRVNGNGGKDG